MNIRLFIAISAASLGALSLQAADAKGIWKNQCSKCHGEDGRGQTRQGKKLNVPDLSTKKVQSLFTDTQGFKIIKEGVKDDNEKVSMKPAEDVTDEEIQGLVKYIRTLQKP